MMKGDLAKAREQNLGALKIREEIGEKSSAAESRVALGELDLEEGQIGEAEISARQAIEEFQAEKLADDEFIAEAVLMRALLAQNKNAEAAKEMTRLSSLAARSQNAEARLKFQLAAAHVSASLHRATEAKKDLDAVLAEATQLGFCQYEFEARLALGEIEMKTGNTSAGRARLGALEKDATAKGFRFIARKTLARRQ